MTTTQHPRTDLTAVAAAGPRVMVGRALKDWVFVPWVRGAAGLPLAIAAVPLALFGRSDTAGRWQSRLALRFDAGAAAGATPRRLGPVRVIGHSLMVALPALASASLAALVAFAFYLAGAWFIHSCVALGIQIGCLLLLRVLVRLQGRITRHVL
jgi:hypothetical protein